MIVPQISEISLPALDRISEERRRTKMQKNLIISMIAGQFAALLPIWDWGDKLTFLTGSICITIVTMIAITWLEDKTKAIKRALTSANVKGLSN